MFDSEPYELKHIQKSSPKASDDFVFVEIFKFFTKNKLKYVIRAEMHEHNVFAVKYYASKHKLLEDKYNRLTNDYDANRIIITCASVLIKLLKGYPTASFAFNGSRTVDTVRDKIENLNNNQRFRIYSYVTDAMVGRETFEHYSFEGVSSYLLVNKKHYQDTEQGKDIIKNMFTTTYQFSSSI